MRFAIGVGVVMGAGVRRARTGVGWTIGVDFAGVSKKKSKTLFLAMVSLLYVGKRIINFHANVPHNRVLLLWVLGT